MVDRGMHLETQLVEGGFCGVLQFRRSQTEQGRFVRGCEKIKFDRHNYLTFRVSGMTGALRGFSDCGVMRRSLTFEVCSPRVFLIISMPRVTTPRLLENRMAVSSLIRPF